MSFTSIPFVVEIILLAGLEPIATRTLSAGMINSLSLFITLRPSNLPSRPTYSTGEVSHINLTLSATALSYSAFSADIFSIPRLYTTVTDLAPILRAVLAASIATLPAPITRTVSPSSTGTSFLSRDLLL